jgi:transcriptional regulator with XRE-family HTH domain
LAKRTGTKKSYISRVENGKIDIQLSTLFKIFEEGLGKRLGLTVFQMDKHNLKIKSFWGTSLNAFKIQVYSAIIAYCLSGCFGSRQTEN